MRSGIIAEGISADQAQLQALLLPMSIAAVGIFLSVLGIFMVRTEEDATQKNLLKALGRGINASTVLVAIVAVFLAWWLMPGTSETQISASIPIPGVAVSIVVGLLAGWLIGKWTEYATSDEYTPTKKLAEQRILQPACSAHTRGACTTCRVPKAQPVRKRRGSTQPRSARTVP